MFEKNWLWCHNDLDFPIAIKEFKLETCLFSRWVGEEDSDDEDDPAEMMAFEKRIGDMPAGLKNLGNTCYVNSFLQVKREVLDVSHYITGQKTHQTPSQFS